METKFFCCDERKFEDHPMYKGVKICRFVAGAENFGMSVCQLMIDCGVEIPIHTHDPQADSIFVHSGCGEAYINGEWKSIKAGDYLIVPPRVQHGVRNTGNTPLFLFIVHNPPIF